MQLRFPPLKGARSRIRSEEHTSELQSRLHLVCRLLLDSSRDSNINSVPMRQMRTRLRERAASRGSLPTDPAPPRLPNNRSRGRSQPFGRKVTPEMKRKTSHLTYTTLFRS